MKKPGKKYSSEDQRKIDREKSYLKRYKRNLAMIGRLEDKLETLSSSLESLQSPKLTGMPRGGDPVTIADKIADKVELEDRIRRFKDKGAAYRGDTLAEIDRLEDPKKADVLELFMIDGETLEQIALELNYSERHVYRLYAQALEYLAGVGVSDRGQ